MKSLPAACAALLFFLPTAAIAAPPEPAASPPVLKVPEGFSIELVAGPPLVDRPIVAAFDDDGRLYVAESSGSNDPVEKQLELRPHRILRLEDVDGDGKFDKRTVFADRMMFPAGAMFVDGSLYVSAPPSIWKLTDSDDDGVAEHREEWFQGKTLTGCANDLHGPYLGPDGWVYWCKGAFAEQTHTVNGREWKSRAAHIFRCRLDGTGLEPVITGGMDNPVDVAFTSGGEAILSATFLVGDGRRDGLVHAIYGGVYGKEHGVLDGHPRTGELMPPLVLMNAAAPCGLDRYDADAFGADYRDNLFACQFNLRKVSRHVLRPAGSSFVTEDSDFVTSDAVDFHPTDVLTEADGSLLVVDTGGWYKLCCPTSQLWKPDVLGGIYRVRRVGAAAIDDPRGRQIPWPRLTVEQLWTFLADARPAVRQRAAREFANRRESEPLKLFLAKMASRGVVAATSDAGACDGPTAAMSRTWALGQLENAESQALTRQMLEHPNEQVRQAASRLASLHRDAAASPQLLSILERDGPANRRVAAEALGRIGDSAAVQHLLTAAASAHDRILQHSIAYALIELADSPATQAGLSSKAPGTVAAALTALDQMPGGALQPSQVIPLLSSKDETLRNSARWVASRRPKWGGVLAQWFRPQLASLPETPTIDPGSVAAHPTDADSLEALLVGFASNPSIQKVLSDAVAQPSSSIAARRLALHAMAQAHPQPTPPSWPAALAVAITEGDPTLLPLAIAAARNLSPPGLRNSELKLALIATSQASRFSLNIRVAALAAAAPTLQEFSEPQLTMLLSALASDYPIELRSAAADALISAPLNTAQLDRLCVAIKSSSPLELNLLLTPFERSQDERLGLKLLSTLKESSALPSLRVDVVRRTLVKYGPAVQQGVDELEAILNVDAAAQRQRLAELLPLMAQGDVRRGQEVFYSSQAGCSACHRLGYTGGAVGPELTRIGELRTERDLLESILYPSLSLVRSYEPVLIVTVDGRAINGIVRDETAQEYVLSTGPDQEVHVPREEVDEIQPSSTSIMPAGLDKQLNLGQLADLVAFLKHSQGQ